MTAACEEEWQEEAEEEEDMETEKEATGEVRAGHILTDNSAGV